MHDSGVTIVSRDGSSGELDLSALPRDVRGSISKIIHDSDNRYHVKIYQEDREIAENIAYQIAQRFVMFAGGFNDIYVEWEGIELAHRGPEWDQERLAFLLAKSEAAA
jgi:hypothetical protein